jgi:acyl-coenzyme A synthetase/AMP-(fatty) acid ligase
MIRREGVTYLAGVATTDGWYTTGDVCQIDERGWVRSHSRQGDVVAQDGVDLDTDDARRHASSELSSTQVPRHVLALGADQLPRTPSGKVRRDELRRVVDSRSPGGDGR